MIKFLDGPAEGVSLSLRNAPESIVVVRGINGKWDAIDMPDEQPRPGEEVFLYRRVGSVGIAHIDCVDKGRRRAMNLPIAQYRHAEP